MSTRSDLLRLYKHMLRGASVYPSSNRMRIYQEIRTEWRLHKHLTVHEDDVSDVDSQQPQQQQKQRDVQQLVSQAYQSLTQLRQFDEVTLTGGHTGSANWNMTLGQQQQQKSVPSKPYSLEE